MRATPRSLLLVAPLALVTLITVFSFEHDEIRSSASGLPGTTAAYGASGGDDGLARPAASDQRAPAAAIASDRPARDRAADFLQQPESAPPDRAPLAPSPAERYGRLPPEDLAQKWRELRHEARGVARLLLEDKLARGDCEVLTVAPGEVFEPRAEHPDWPCTYRGASNPDGSMTYRIVRLDPESVPEIRQLSAEREWIVQRLTVDGELARLK